MLYGECTFSYCFVDTVPPKPLKIGDFGAWNRLLWILEARMHILFCESSGFSELVVSNLPQHRWSWAYTSFIGNSIVDLSLRVAHTFWRAALKLKGPPPLPLQIHDYMTSQSRCFDMLQNINLKSNSSSNLLNLLAKILSEALSNQVAYKKV